MPTEINKNEEEEKTAIVEELQALISKHKENMKALNIIEKELFTIYSEVRDLRDKVEYKKLLQQS